MVLTFHPTNRFTSIWTFWKGPTTSNLEKNKFETKIVQGDQFKKNLQGILCSAKESTIQYKQRANFSSHAAKVHSSKLKLPFIENCKPHRTFDLFGINIYRFDSID
jgi:hypothetical protein